MKLRPPTMEALGMLAKTICYTASTTFGDSTISGVIAKRLVELGLAKYTSGWQIGQRGALTRVAITDLGKETYDRVSDLGAVRRRVDRKDTDRP